MVSLTFILYALLLVITTMSNTTSAYTAIVEYTWVTDSSTHLSGNIGISLPMESMNWKVSTNATLAFINATEQIASMPADQPAPKYTIM